MGSEYGWTPQTIFDTLTRPQVEVYLSAIGRRYKRQADAYGKETKDSNESSIEDLLKKQGPTGMQAALRDFQIQVEQ